MTKKINISIIEMDEKTKLFLKQIEEFKKMIPLYFKVGIAASETEQAIKEFNDAVKNIRSHYTFMGWILYRLGLL